MLIAIVPLLAAVIGLLIFVLAKEPLKEVGRCLFWCGTLVTLFVAASHTVKFG